MNIVIHDFSGHAFPAQLARALARRGHHVTHLSSSSYATGKGNLVRGADDPQALHFVDVPVPGGWDKYSYGRRIIAERRYAAAVLRSLRNGQQPDVVMSSNVPLFAHAQISRGLRRRDIPEVFWHQDVYSAAIGGMAVSKFGPAGRPLAWRADRIERSIANRSRSVVAISDDFLAPYRRWGLSEAKITVQPNWAPLQELPTTHRRNPWARRHGLCDKQPVFLYAGTLGLKHNPSRLLTLAHELHADSGKGCVVVASEGPGIDFLERQRPAHLKDRLLLLPFQPYEDVPSMLGAVDVLVTLLEPEAARYSVPSKVLTYHCAGRALLASIPDDNDAARMINETGSGLVVEPDDDFGWAKAVKRLANSEELRRTLGTNARAFAESAFDIETITTRFESILRRATGASGR